MKVFRLNINTAFLIHELRLSDYALKLENLRKHFGKRLLVVSSHLTYQERRRDLAL